MIIIKKIKIITFSFLTTLIVFLKILFPNIFLWIKNMISKSLSLYSLSFLLVGNPYTYNEVARTNEISVKECIYYEESIYVNLLNNEVTLPFSGIVIKKNKDVIGVEVSKNIIFYLNVDNSPCFLYEYVTPDTILAYQNSYLIYSNDIKNLEYLNYKVSYNEI